MDEPNMGFFSRIYYSMAGFGRYRYFLRQSTGKAVVYLLLITLVLGVITLIPTVHEYNKVVDGLIANFDSKIPDFSFANGKLEVSGKMPIIIDDGGATIIIDTTPNAEESILDVYDSVMLITSDRIIQKNYVNKRVTELNTLQGVVLTRDSVKQILPLMKALIIFIFIFGGIFFICGKFISALFISLIGLIINSARKTNLSYRSIFKISVYSLTLPLFLCTLLSLLPVRIPYLWIPFYVIAAVYVYGVINTMKIEIDSSSGSSSDSSSSSSDSDMLE